MIEFYAEIRLAHVAAVITSGALFFVRGLLVQAGRAPWALAVLPRYLSYAVDTILLTAALMLLTILPGAMFANGWLAVKLSLLVLYVGLGTFALKRGQTARTRRACYVLALMVFAFMATVARAHHPLGAAWRWLA
jgi:uncharacterized membrane protein SirB2